MKINISMLSAEVSQRVEKVKFSRRDFEIFFYYFSQKTGFDLSGKLSPLETIRMKCHSLFSGEKKEENIINLLSAQFLPEW